MFDDGMTGRTALRQIRASEEIAAALATVEFPITKQELILQLGNRFLSVDPEMEAPLAEIVRGVAAKGFTNVREAQRAVDQRWARMVKSLAEIERAEERRG